MKLARSDVEYRLSDFQGQVFSACRMGAWCFNEEKHLYLSTAPHQEEYHLFLRAGGVLDQAIGLKDTEALPHILGGTLGLVWIAEWVHLRSGGHILVILGPVYLKNASVEESLQALDRQGISQHLRRQYLNVLGDVPVLRFDMVRQYACMLHYTCYLEVAKPVILTRKSEQPNAQKGNVAQSGSGNDYQRMAAYEEMLLRHLGEGTQPPEESPSFSGELQDFDIRDTLRLIKDNLLIFTGLCARTAIRSGVPVYTAKKLESEWVSRIEAARSFPEAHRLREAMYNAFLRQVRQTRESTGLSKAVRDCRSYIQANYMNEITLEDLARHCGYAEYYLSRKFAKETGMKISDYIHSVRIDAAKLLLLTTSREIQEISDLLRFGNRSHFDRVFRQHVGVSPAKFREQGGQIQKSKETT